MPRSATIITSLDFYSTEVNPSTDLGALAQSYDGRSFRYAKAGASALVIGNALQSPVNDDNFKDMAVQAAAVVGARTIAVTLGGSATTTANQFQGAQLVVSVTPGIGQVLEVLSNDVQSTTNGTCNFYLKDPLLVALTTSSKVSIYKNLYNGVIQSPTTSTGIGVGGAVTAIPAGNYGWIQTHGYGAALGDATASTAAAQALSRSVTTAGAVTKAVSLAEIIGISVPVASVSTEVEPIFWKVD